ncbi:MAG: class I SAM-dependent methyltransferase [Candidatus Daviesbacteria bacterium]|nr:MAG: class I SAM-dependent methyltransferase [Candidatus Daviesbacteria bacterium]
MIFEAVRKLALPFAEIEKYVPQRGKILDVGCGHGIFSEMLAQKSPTREVLGIDPAINKIRLAQAHRAGLPNLKFKHAYLPEINSKFDCIIIIDVLYLLPIKKKVEILTNCKKLLKKNGILILKEVEKTGSLMFFITKLEEIIMVQLLKYTYSDKGNLYFVNTAYYLKLLRKLGFKKVKSRQIRAIIPYPHMLFVFRA